MTTTTPAPLPPDSLLNGDRPALPWPSPPPPARWVPWAAGGAGVVAAVTMAGTSRPGLGLPLSAMAAAVPVVLSARRRGRVSAALGVVALGLTFVALVRDSQWLVWGCALAGLCLAAVAALDLKRWLTLPLTVPLALAAAGRSVAWVGWWRSRSRPAAAPVVRRPSVAARADGGAGAGVPSKGAGARPGAKAVPPGAKAVPPGRPAPDTAAGAAGAGAGAGAAGGPGTASIPTVSLVDPAAQPWVVGIGVGVVFTAVIGGLLASADSAFADALAALGHPVDLGRLPLRVFWFVAAGLATLGGCFAVRTRIAEPKPGAPTPRHPAEWAVPLGLVGVTIAAFLAVEARMLFAGGDVVATTAHLSHADRARQGFWQLTAVTILVLALLAWAGRRAGGSHRRILGVAGGALVALGILLAVSALRRLALYQDAYGWTVTRVNAWAFEGWLILVLAGLALAWATRRTDLMPRLVAGSAGVGLLVTALIGPDAIVAAGSVHRYETRHEIDVPYLVTLSDDAAPALSHLPVDLRACFVPVGERPHDTWATWNLSRHRATAIHREDPTVTLCAVPSSTP